MGETLVIKQSPEVTSGFGPPEARTHTRVSATTQECQHEQQPPKPPQHLEEELHVSRVVIKNMILNLGGKQHETNMSFCF